MQDFLSWVNDDLSHRTSSLTSLQLHCTRHHAFSDIRKDVCASGILQCRLDPFLASIKLLDNLWYFFLCAHRNCVTEMVAEGAAGANAVAAEPSILNAMSVTANVDSR